MEQLAEPVVARHAALAWDVHAFLGTLLEPDERALVEAERLRALADLRVALREEPVDELVRTAGLPDATCAALLLDALVPELAAAA